MSKPTQNFPRPKKQRLPPKETTKSWLDTKHSIRDVAKGVYDVGKFVAGIINTQLKSFDAAPFSGTSISSGGTVLCISLLSQGPANGAYLGNELHARELQTNCHAALGSAPLSGCVLRVIVFQDSSAAGAIPAVTDVLTTASVDSFYNIINVNPEKMRFKILSDERYCLGSSWQQVLCCGNRRTIPTVDGQDEILYQSPFNGSTASINKNNIFVLAISDQSVAANEPVLSMTTRLFYESF